MPWCNVPILIPGMCAPPLRPRWAWARRCLAWLAAPLAVLFLKNEAVVPLVRVQPLGFILVGLGATATSLLRREMRFEAIAKVEVAAYILGYGGVGITLAMLGAGV